MKRNVTKEVNYVRVGDDSLSVIGDITSGSNIAVSGNIGGNINTYMNCLKINSDCVVTGNLIAGLLIVEGVVHGEIHASRVEIRDGGEVNGPITTNIIVIDEGGKLNGICNTVHTEIPEQGD